VKREERQRRRERRKVKGILQKVNPTTAKEMRAFKREG
jgi:hypothetical protein